MQEVADLEQRERRAVGDGQRPAEPVVPRTVAQERPVDRLVDERPVRQRGQRQRGEEPAPARVLRQQPQREDEELDRGEAQCPGGQRD